MSAFASLLGALGGPATAAALVAGGLVAGIVGGGVVAGAATGGGSAGASPAAGTLPVYPCPDAGPALATAKGGQRLLVTGRTEDGAWVRIHLPAPGRTEGWVQATPLTVKGDITSLPVVECQAELAITPPEVAPEPSLTAIVNATPPPTPSPTPTPTPSPTITPTPPPADKAPSIASLRVSTSRISYDTGDYCPDAGTSVTFRARASDDAGIASVRLFWRKPGANGYTQTTMARTGGSAKSGTWQANLDTGTNGIRTAGKLAYYAVATDTAGKTRRVPSRGSDTITVAVCENTGPTITGIRSSSGGSLYWQALRGAVCDGPTATNITATIRDVDGVTSATLYYRPPGSTWQSKPMTKGSRNTWTARLSTADDGISITDPPTDALRWYIKAVDDKGKGSQTSTKSTTIRRCDTEANFDGVFPQGTTYACSTAARITLGTYANDADQNGDGLKVVFYWSLSNPRTGDGPITGKMTASVTKGNYYQGTTATFNGQRFYAGRLTAYVVTTDRYGGTTTSPVDGPYSMACTQ